MPSIVVDVPPSLKVALDSETARTKASPSAVVTAALAQYLGTPVLTIFQVSTSGALVAGIYSSAVSVKTILNHGDFGLGTFANLDGEMVALDGLVYQVQGTGRVSVAPSDAGAPFAIATRFSPELDTKIGAIESFKDPVAHDLRLSMRPALAAGPEETPELFVDHVALALSIHVARIYGDVAALPKQWGGGLAPWQERRAKEFLDAHIDGGITLNVLARACELSNRHFTRAFRQSTGMAPHQWLQYRRIEKAKHLLDKSSASLRSIALDCGFADQSHFTRTFSRVVGVPPGTWRRTKRE